MTDPLSPTPLSEQERVALVTMLRDGPNHRDWPERYVEVMGFINRLSSAPTPLSEQEIRVGDRFLWEPSKPYATEHCVVTRVEGKGVWSRSWVPTSKISGGYTGPNVWNEVDRFREAAVPLARLSPGVAEPPVEHLPHCEQFSSQGTAEADCNCPASLTEPPPLAEPQAEERDEIRAEGRRLRAGVFGPGDGFSRFADFMLSNSDALLAEPPPVAEGVVLLDGKQWRLDGDGYDFPNDGAYYLVCEHNIGNRYGCAECGRPGPVLPDPQEEPSDD